ncbi:ATP-grasp domain-containing protein [Streptomyces sp. WAC 00631]|uniref:acetyl/propionyl/methylcrotonyl-CoA carboxylase subunit alpha n=1 Tax=Streptomyces sp. WAC 00631 TaxID=2203201 RepID=UPI000F7AB242|nr:biotin carboxylase N-terminal domain-containing protein [Streptomyces sp. WAC 00631]MCC5033367.1 ATP-grasp domain-containing protein [Streptomyces sp. WAC 00631]
MFESVLVANRGEIAVRVIRTLRRLGVRSVAVFSDADAGARHVREADTAVRIGPTAAAESYLSVERLLDAAARSGAQAVHPGYGFLAENAAFARACEEAGLVFIGPPPGAIELMGDKIRAKETVRAAGVPVVPGSSGSGLTDAELATAAREIGMPVLLKPSAGGGGKGMRLVRSEEVLAEEIAAARREARGSFGDDTLLVERWIDRPRHIEIQLLADGHGNVVHLGERECSLQRRHQKIVEEAPSPLLDEATRAAMGEAAVQAARSCGYRGAGTVEFIVPGSDPSAYYFMEMNTRLQVEHPVTELVTGLDLVEWQLRAAAGEPLGFGQQDIRLTGHAVEARLCAETARAADGGRVDFLPSAGTVRLLREPAGEGVRVDSGLSPGTEVGTAYDPMLAKVVAHGPDRATALRRLRAALAGTDVLGVDTNAGFLRRLLAHPEVVSGEMDTGLVDRDAASLLRPSVPAEVYAAAALLRHAALAAGGGADAGRASGEAGGPAAPGGAAGDAAGAPGTAAGGPEGSGGRPGWTDPFSVPSGWRLGGTPAWTPHPVGIPGHEPVTVHVRGPLHAAEIRMEESAVTPPATTAPAGTAAAAGPDGVGPDGAGPDGAVRARLVPGSDGPSAPGARLLVEYAGVTHVFHHAPDGAGGHWLGRDGDAWHATAHDPVAAALRGGAGAGQAGALTAPMPGTVTVVKAAVGDAVTAGQSLLVVEAMKMEHVIAAPHDGTVTELDVTPGSTVAMDQVLAVVAPHEPAATADGGPAVPAAAITEEASDVPS